jgi:RNA polymerase sigma-70 factor (TIGR02957 family)
MESTGPETVLAVFERERRQLFGVAYRMLGTIAETEDVLQDAYLRWARLSETDRSDIEHPRPYLVRLVTRLCIDMRRSAHARRMEYVGPWLPEPLVLAAGEALTSDPVGPQDVTEDLSVAFLVMLERLTPVERAVFVLKESFDYTYRDIAPVVQKSEQNCRQIHRRALVRLKKEARTSGPFDRERHERLLHQFLEATRHGDVDALVAVLAEDAISFADGGGKVFAARRPISGAANIARYLTELVRHAPAGLEFRIGRVNGEAGLLTYIAGRLHNVIAISVDGERIRRILIIANPDKLPRAER